MTVGVGLAVGASRRAIERVKIHALSDGLRIRPDVLASLGGPDALTIHEYATTGGITLELPLGVLVNAPFDAHHCASSPLELARGPAGLELQLDDITVLVQSVLPLPGYLNRRDSLGRRVADVVMSHADRIRVSPIVGCAYDCSFCDLANLRYTNRPVEQILSALDVALDDLALVPNHLLISGGSPSTGSSAQLSYFEQMCLAVARHLRDLTTPEGQPFEVGVMMSARPDGPGFVERVVAGGISSFSLNVEVHSDAAATRVMPLKHRRSREHLGPMISKAVELLGWGTGRVRSLIIPGLEPPSATLAGVEWLASLGCSPVLSPFRPAPGTSFQASEPVSAADLRVILEESRAIAARHGVPLGPHCVPCQHNTLTFPWDVTAEAA